MAYRYDDVIDRARRWHEENGGVPSRREWDETVGEPSSRTIDRRWGWKKLWSEHLAVPPTDEQVRRARRARAGVAARDHYGLPRIPVEIDRLDMQHYLFRAVQGRNFLAPVRRPSTILDLGCGTGQWAAEVCAQFPKAQVVGLDLAHHARPTPGNYGFVRASLLAGLPFPDDSFSFVHQRLLVSGIPLGDWPSELREVVRVTRPGGWVELVEGVNGVEPAGPATARLAELIGRLAIELGLDGTDRITRSFDELLAGAGAIDVERHDILIPVGEWAGQVGTYMAADLRAIYTRVADRLQGIGGISAREYDELLRTMFAEMEEHHSNWRLVHVIGRKPSGRRARSPSGRAA